MIDKSTRYDSFEEFFYLNGNISMRLTAQAAKDVCLHAAKRRIIIWRVEGGIWHHPGFEARHDCIWDGPDNQMTQEEAHQNNLHALEFIEEEESEHDVFILTTRTLERIVQPPIYHPLPK